MMSNVNESSGYSSVLKMQQVMHQKGLAASLMSTGSHGEDVAKRPEAKFVGWLTVRRVLKFTPQKIFVWSPQTEIRPANKHIDPQATIRFSLMPFNLANC